MNVSSVRDALRSKREFAVPGERGTALRGYVPAYDGVHGYQERLDDDSWWNMLEEMARLGVTYIVESRQTVIAWTDGQGRWHWMSPRTDAVVRVHQDVLRQVLDEGVAMQADVEVPHG